MRGASRREACVRRRGRRRSGSNRRSNGLWSEQVVVIDTSEVTGWRYYSAGVRGLLIKVSCGGIRQVCAPVDIFRLGIFPLRCGMVHSRHRDNVPRVGLHHGRAGRDRRREIPRRLCCIVSGSNTVTCVISSPFVYPCGDRLSLQLAHVLLLYHLPTGVFQYFLDFFGGSLFQTGE